MCQWASFARGCRDMTSSKRWSFKTKSCAGHQGSSGQTSPPHPSLLPTKINRDLEDFYLQTNESPWIGLSWLLPTKNLALVVRSLACPVLLVSLLLTQSKVPHCQSCWIHVSGLEGFEGCVFEVSVFEWSLDDTCGKICLLNIKSPGSRWCDSNFMVRVLSWHKISSWPTNRSKSNSLQQAFLRKRCHGIINILHCAIQFINNFHQSWAIQTRLLNYCRDITW